jgi:hypothetical protein
LITLARDESASQHESKRQYSAFHFKGALGHKYTTKIRRAK